MFKLFFHNNTIVVYNQSDKEFKAKYGTSYEQIAVVKDDSNLTPVINKMKKQYRTGEVILDYKIKKKMGWKYFTEEQKLLYRSMMSKTRAGRPLSEHQKKRISEGKTGKRGNHTGKRHSKNTRNVMALRATGHKRNVGKKWCYDPMTGKEYRKEVLPEGMLWGRNPDLEFGKMFSL